VAVGQKQRTTENRKSSHANMPDRFMTKAQKQFNKGSMALPTNGAGAIGHPMTKINNNNKISTQVSHLIQK